MARLGDPNPSVEDWQVAPAHSSLAVVPGKERGTRRARIAESRRLQQRLADAALRAVKMPPSGYRDDCSGLVCAVLGEAGARATGGVRTLWARAQELGAVHHRTVPDLGDLVFFDDTYDADGDGRWNDPLTHIGVVIDVDEDGTITLVHGGTSAGRTTIRMNLRRPADHVDDDGRVINGWLRRQRPSDPRGARYLTGELWRGFATVRPEDLERWSGA